MNVELEELRLHLDYPKLTPRYEVRSGEWHCDLMIETRMFGLYGYKTGCGANKLEALLDARRRLEESVAEEKKQQALHAQRVQEAVAAEQALDAAIFNDIPSPPARTTHVGTHI